MLVILLILLDLHYLAYNIILELRESNEMLTIQYEKVKASEKTKEEFINITAHELRTPIQPILGLSDIMYPKVKDEEQRELLDDYYQKCKKAKASY